MKSRYTIIKLAVLLIVAPVVIWVAALSKTARLYRDYRNLGKSVEAIHEEGQRLNLADAVHQDLISDGHILAGIEKQFSGVSVYSFTPKVEIEEAGLSLVKTKIELKGDYKSLLRVLHGLEEDGNYALSDITFERKDQREKKVTLKLTVNQLIRNE